LRAIAIAIAIAISICGCGSIRLTGMVSRVETGRSLHRSLRSVRSWHGTRSSHRHESLHWS